MIIAVEGCAHGELDAIYNTLSQIMIQENIKIDLLICCGDFQCPRNIVDMECMSMPEKYLSMGSFYKYYSGEKIAPILTLFIHGNHECVNYLRELYFGGWVAPNIYYLGYSGVVNFGGIRIGGLSGIFSERDFMSGHHERPPYKGNSSKSSYHVREYEVWKLMNITQPIDIVVSHDWPRGIYHFGNTGQLLSKKPFFRDEINRNELGSPPAQAILCALRPNYWFSAHLHVKFPAIVQHPPKEGTDQGQTTHFLALDKCLPNRDFLQVLDPGSKEEFPQLRYDIEWLAILRETTPYFSFDQKASEHPPNVELLSHINELSSIANQNPEFLLIPNNFSNVAPCFDPNKSFSEQIRLRMANPFDNPQTIEFCEKFGIQCPSNQSSTQRQPIFANPESTTTQSLSQMPNPDEINLDDF